jgi:hypothetical protein
MANLALHYHWQWSGMMAMPIEELLAFHDVMITATASGQ